MGRATKAAMGREEQVNMDSDKRVQVLHDLEMKHQNILNQSELLIKDEDARRLKLRIQILRDEFVALRDQLGQKDDNIVTLTERCDQLRAQVDGQSKSSNLQEKQLRKLERDFATAKAELQSMNDVSRDSSKILGEKLALSRELALLKPEVEHLRSQLSNQQATLAEKLSLERQVTSLEVELANEKKTTDRAAKKRESNDRVEDELRAQLREAEKKFIKEKTAKERLEDELTETMHRNDRAAQDRDSTREVETDLRRRLRDLESKLKEESDERIRLEELLGTEQRAAKQAQKSQAKSSTDAEDELREELADAQKKLASERKEREKLSKENERLETESDKQREHLEQRLEKLKAKLREAQEQLKQSQADLRKAQQNKPSGMTTQIPLKGEPARKRKAQDMTVDDFTSITIGTPGDMDNRGRRGAKKRGLDLTLMGEKSTFSITPFLNRTKNITDGGTIPEEEEGEEGEEVEASICPQPEATATVQLADSVVTEDITKELAELTEAPVEKATTVAPPIKQTKARGRPKKALQEVDTNKKASKPPVRKQAKFGNTLENVTEESEDPSQENQPQSSDSHKQITSKIQLKTQAPVQDDDSTGSFGEQPKKKKRKVLGSTKTLFDEDEGEAPVVAKRPKVQIGGSKLGAKKGMGKGPLDLTRKAFAGAAFSPLKKDRRGVNASFLS